MIGLVWFVFVVGLPLAVMDTDQDDNVQHYLDIVMTSMWGNFNKILNDGFQNVSSTLLLIDAGLRHVTVDTKNCSSGSYFKDNVAVVDVLAETLKIYLKNPPNNTEYVFGRLCRDHLEINVGSWIRRELIHGNQVQSLIDDLQQLDDPDKLIAWSHLVMLTFIKASILSDVCLGMVYANATGLEETQEIFRNNARQDLSQIIRHLNWTDNDLRAKTKWVFSATLEAMESLINDTDPIKINAKFINGVFVALERKYFWRNWLIGICDGTYDLKPSFATIENHEFEHASVHWHNKTFFMTSFDTADANTSFDYFDKCMHDYWVQPRQCGESCTCHEFLEKLKDCTKSFNPVLSYKEIFCVIQANNFQVKVRANGSKMYGVTLFKGKDGFTVTEMDNYELKFRRDIIVFL